MSFADQKLLAGLLDENADDEVAIIKNAIVAEERRTVD
jgi:hypothetical protein